jgi:hypothetical protein
VTYRKHFDEILHFAVVRVDTGDDAFEIGEAFHKAGKSLLECCVVNQFLNCVKPTTKDSKHAANNQGECSTDC